MRQQVTDVFDELWNKRYDRQSHDDAELGLLNDNRKLVSWSDGLITSWVRQALAGRTTLRILDAGCGGVWVQVAS